MKSSLRSIARSTQPLRGGLPGLARWTEHLIPLPGLVKRTRHRPRPFFTALHELLDKHPVITLGCLLDEAGEQAYGLTVLLLALLTFIPGVANILSLATLVVGFYMMWGAPHPWIPGRLQAHALHRGRIKELLAQIEARIAWMAKRRRVRKAPSQRLVGFLVAWTAFIAALPIPLPFANALPAVALVLFGVALLEEWPSLAWMGSALTLGTTAYFAMSFEVAWRAVRALFRGMMG